MRLPPPQSAFVFASALTVASFVGATAYSQSRLTALDTLSATIASNAIPSIEYLGRGGVRLQRLRQLIYDGVTIGASPDSIKIANAELDALDDDVARYLQLTPLAGERDLWIAMQHDLDQAKIVARSVLQTLENNDKYSAAALLKTEAEPAFERAGHTMLRAMEFDVRESERLAREVRSLRRATTQNIILLDTIATAVAAFTAVIAFRVAQEHDRLLRSHNSLLTLRVAELDRFAGRVAHDILSPLHAVGMGLALVGRSAVSGQQTHLDRAQRALQRVKELVDGLLRFARAGAEIDSTARCSVDVVMNSVASDCLDSARSAGIALSVESPDRLEVACSVGVLTSIVQNLVSNAIKYIGDGPHKRVTLRARSAAGKVVLEVEDTGPGIAPAVQATMFEPFVRGSHDDIAGLGLGLATVKRLVDGVGGTIAVQSQVGNGTVFTIELPLAPEPSSTDSSVPTA